MNLFAVLTDRVYIRVASSYEISDAVGNFENLIAEVARHNTDANGCPLCNYDHGTEHIYLRKTKAFIVQKAKAYINEMAEEGNCAENMASFVSIKQLSRLMAAFEADQRCISCYSMVYIYIIYTLLEGKSKYAQECLSFAYWLANITEAYYKNNQGDVLSAFLCNCSSVIIHAIQDSDTALPVECLPKRPRKHIHTEDQDIY